MKVIGRALPLLTLGIVLACGRGETREADARDTAAVSVPVIEGFADAMEAEARAEPPCLTSRDTVRRNWTRATVPSLNGEILLPPRFEAHGARGSEATEWVNPDSARLSLVISRTDQGSHAVGSAVGGHPERRCHIRIAGRAARIVELIVPRPARNDTAYGAITIAFPSDSLTISATILAPTRDLRTELLNALSTLTVRAMP